MALLIVDTRERNVLRHTAEFEQINHEVKQITVGDYVVRYGDLTLAVIERKSLEDYAASIKDGRSENKNKLIDLRNQTGCTVVYLIEGPSSPKPDALYGGIPYKHIESSIFHLCIRDKFVILYSESTLDTAKKLVRFVNSMNTLAKKEGWVVGGGDPSQPIDTQLQSTSSSLLTQPRPQSTVDNVRAMWAKFPGIATESADDYMVFSLNDVFCSTVDLSTHKLSTGRKVSKKVIANVASPSLKIQINVLSCVPGISKVVAESLLSTMTLGDFLKLDDSVMSILQPSKKCLGLPLCGRIREHFGYIKGTL